MKTAAQARLGFLARVLAGLVVICVSAPAFAIEIIVNQANPATAVSNVQLRDFFYKKRRTWPNGEAVRFIDRTKGSPERKKFLSEVLKKTEEEVELHWIGQKLYSGDSAPLQESSDARVIHFVSKFPGAIGYVNKATSLEGKNVKAIKLE